jgi:hypothetical protein
MRQYRCSLATAACVIFAGLVGHVLGQTPGRQCGGAGGANNAACAKNTCTGNCKRNAATPYKVCQAGTGTCRNSYLWFSCPGDSMDGANCTGTNIGPCQLNTLSCR